MKRSEINQIIKEAKTFLSQQKFFLPPFAFWTLNDWQRKEPSLIGNIIRTGLGWDITDFGQGDFKYCGLFLFTLRNGDLKKVNQPRSKNYAEKVMIVGKRQITPLHFHTQKTEDVINRGGGNLIIKIYATRRNRISEKQQVRLEIDGIFKTLDAGEKVVLQPGQSITLPAKVYHTFWAEREKTLVGEVSRVNNDLTDNYFFNPIGRFPEINEDVEPIHLLVSDYKKFLKQGKKNEGLVGKDFS